MSSLSSYNSSSSKYLLSSSFILLRHDMSQWFLFSFLTSCCFSLYLFFFFLMIRRPPRSTLDRSSAASDVYKRQIQFVGIEADWTTGCRLGVEHRQACGEVSMTDWRWKLRIRNPVSYTPLRAPETVLDTVCRLLLEKKTQQTHAPHSMKRTQLLSPSD